MALSLDLKIRALVEGLENVNQLAKALRETANESVSSAAKTDDAYKALGNGSFAEIRAEIDNLKTAFRQAGDESASSAAKADNAYKTLVNGQFTEIRAEIDKLKTAYRQASDESVSAANKTDAAYRTIGIRSFVEIRAEINKVITAYRQLEQSGTLSSREQSVALEAARVRVKALTQELSGIRESSGIAGNGLSGLLGLIGPSIAGFVSLSTAIGSLKKASEAAIELDRIKNALQSTIGSADGARSEYAFVREEAARLGLSLQQSAKDYTSLTAATKGTTLAGQQTRAIFTAVSEASSVLGLSAESTSGALLAIQQIVSKGTVSAEELRGQLGERLPGAFQIAARSIGVTTQELDKLLETGALASEDFLPKFTAELEKTFKDGVAGSVSSARAEFQRLENAIFEASAAVGQSGLNEGLAGAAKSLREGISDPLVIAGLGAIGDLIGLIAKGLGVIAEIIGFLLIPVFGLLFAGIKDGFSLLFAGLARGVGFVINAAAIIIENFGRIVSFFNVDLSNSIIEAGKKVRELGDSLDDSANEIVDNFEKGETAVGKFGKSVEESANKAAQETDATAIAAQKASAAYDALGLKLQTIGDKSYLVPVNTEFDGLNKKITELATNTQATSLQFRQSFEKGLDAAKTLTDLNEIGNSLNLAAKAGKNIDEALRSTNARFEEVFATSLKTAKTIDDFNLLEAQLKQLGANGTVSIKLVDQAVQELNDKFINTKDQAALLTKQLTDLGKVNLDVAKSQLNVARADFEVGKSRLDVWKAQNKYAQDGSELSRAELNLAQANLRLAEAKAADARLAFAEERAHRDVVLQSQRDELALIRLKLDPGNEALILAEKAAKAGLEGAQSAYELAKQRSEKQQEITLKVEEEVLKQRLVVEQTRAVAEQTKEAARQAGTYADSAKTGAGYISNAAQGATQLAGRLGDAASAAGSLTSNLQGATAEQLKLAQAIQGVANAQRLVDSAQGNTPGVKSLTDPNQPNNPTNLQDFINNGKNNSNFTDSNGVVFSKNSQGQLGNNQTPTGSTTISAEENRFFDFKEGKIAVPDRRDTEFLLQKFAAARANLQVADALPAGFGGAFRQSAQASYNVIRRALEALGINTQNGGTASVSIGTNKNNSGGFASPYKNQPGFEPNNQPSTNQFNANTLLDRVAPPQIDLTQNAIKSSAPDKTIQVVFTDGSGKQVPLTTNAENEQGLLDLLARAKGVAA